MASLLIRGGERISRLETGHRPSGGRAVLNRLAEELTTKVEDAAGMPRLEQLRRTAAL